MKFIKQVYLLKSRGKGYFKGGRTLTVSMQSINFDYCIIVASVIHELYVYMCKRLIASMCNKKRKLEPVIYSLKVQRLQRRTKY